MSSNVPHHSCGSILEFTDKVRDKEKCIAHLQQLGLLATGKTCKKCQRPMTLITKSVRVTSDLKQWICTKCKTSLSIRDGSIFKVKYSNFIVILIYFINTSSFS